MDVTGLGFPMWQEMEDDEAIPADLKESARGYFFNAAVPVGVDVQMVAQDQNGQLRDQYGAQVKKVWNDLTGQDDYVVYMPMIEASTRYLREMVDKTFLLLPFDREITRDMRGETQQRVQRVAGLKKKPNAFHDLDAQRAMAMAYRAEAVEAALRGLRARLGGRRVPARASGSHGSGYRTRAAPGGAGPSRQSPQDRQSSEEPDAVPGRGGTRAIPPEGGSTCPSRKWAKGSSSSASQGKRIRARARRPRPSARGARSTPRRPARSADTPYGYLRAVVIVEHPYQRHVRAMN
jgi:hypothetical protein